MGNHLLTTTQTEDAAIFVAASIACIVSGFMWRYRRGQTHPLSPWFQLVQLAVGAVTMALLITSVSVFLLGNVNLTDYHVGPFTVSGSGVVIVFTIAIISCFTLSATAAPLLLRQPSQNMPNLQPDTPPPIQRDDDFPAHVYEVITKRK